MPTVGPGDGASPSETHPPDTYVFDLSHAAPSPYAETAGQLGPGYFANHALLFRPAFSTPTTNVRSLPEVGRGADGSVFKTYNRFGCQQLEPGDADRLARIAFGGSDTLAVGPAVTVDAITIELPDDPVLHTQAGAACFAVRSVDGVWHASWAPVAAVHDEPLKTSRVTLEVHAAHVDAVALVFDTPAWVTRVTYVARAE